MQELLTLDNFWWNILILFVSYQIFLLYVAYKLSKTKLIHVDRLSERERDRVWLFDEA